MGQAASASERVIVKEKLTARCVFHDGHVGLLETSFTFQLTLVIVGDSIAPADRLIFLGTFRALTKGQISTFNTNGMVVT